MIEKLGRILDLNRGPQNYAPYQHDHETLPADNRFKVVCYIPYLYCTRIYTVFRKNTHSHFLPYLHD